MGDAAWVDGKCCDCGYDGPEETECLVRKDKTHCAHWWDAGEAPKDTTQDQARKVIADEVINLVHEKWVGMKHSAYRERIEICRFVVKEQLDKILAAERERDAKMVDTPCGMDDDPKGYTCERRGAFPVRHDPACGREDAAAIRRGDG